MSKERRPDSEDEKGTFTPASPVKRALAWVGLFYMLVLVGLSTYFYFTGKMLMGIAPLLAVPGLLGLAAVAVISWKTTGTPSRTVTVILAVVLTAVALLILPDGLRRLFANFGG